MHSYSREEIDAFCTTLSVSAAFSESQAHAILSDIATEIEAMPPVLQILLIEGECAVTLNKGRGGSYSKGQGIEWRTDKAPLDGFTRRAIHHELGHSIDMRLGKLNHIAALDDEDSGYASKLSKDWHKAVDRELARGRSLWRRTRIQAQRSNLYDGCVTLERHLFGESAQDTTRYASAQFPQEAFAETIVHLGRLYIRSGGNMRAVHEALSEAYPDMWEAFDKLFRSKMNALAKSALDKREKAVSRYAKVTEEFNRLAGKPFDQQTVRHHAKIKAAGRTLAYDTAVLERKIKKNKTGIAPRLGRFLSARIRKVA